MRDLEGNRILVTAPEPRATRLCAEIVSQGGEAVALPALQIMPLELSSTSLQSVWLETADLVIFISPNAVRYGADTIKRLTTGAKIAAVGESTASMLLEKFAEVDIQVPASGAGTALLDAILEHVVVPERVCIVRGHGGRENLATGLCRAGADVFYLECYQRSPCRVDPSRLASILGQGSFQCVLITSVEGATSYLGIAGRSSSVSKAVHIVPGERVAHYLSANSDLLIYAARSALDKDLLAAAAAACQ